MTLQQDKQKWQWKALHSPRLNIIPRNWQFTHIPYLLPHLHRLCFGTFLHLLQHSNYCFPCSAGFVSHNTTAKRCFRHLLCSPPRLTKTIDNSHPFSWEFNDTEYSASIQDTTFTALSSPEHVAVILLICRMESSQLSPLAHKQRLHHYNPKNISMQHRVICKLEKTRFVVICFL